jgi:hypothetical protein
MAVDFAKVPELLNDRATPPALAARVSGLQHSRNIVLTATFRPTECLIGFLCSHMPRRKRLPTSSRGLSREQRRALKVLADAPRGASEEMLVVVHGFSAQMVAGLVHAGLATVVSETKKAPRGLTITVERIRITDEGKKAIEG